MHLPPLEWKKMERKRDTETGGPFNVLEAVQEQRPYKRQKAGPFDASEVYQDKKRKRKIEQPSQALSDTNLPPLPPFQRKRKELLDTSEAVQERRPYKMETGSRLVVSESKRERRLPCI
ncbi:hypothetical protein A1F94_010285 [Pyrenophora tritici-repentis]|nr:hypothetical protein A1F94_010285 [Pyrenophora tritici-repentis]